MIYFFLTGKFIECYTLSFHYKFQSYDVSNRLHLYYAVGPPSAFLLILRGRPGECYIFLFLDWHLPIEQLLLYTPR